MRHFVEYERKKMKYGLSFINSNHVCSVLYIFTIYMNIKKRCYLARVRKHLSSCKKRRDWFFFLFNVDAEMNMRMSLRPRVNSQRQLMINYISIVAKLDRNPNCFRYIYIIYTHIWTHKIFYVWGKECFLLCGVWIFGLNLRECECTFFRSPS